MDYHQLESALIGAVGSNYYIFFTLRALRKKLLYSFRNWNIQYPMNRSNPFTAYLWSLFDKLNPLFSIFVNFLSNFYLVLSLKNLIFLSSFDQIMNINDQTQLYRCPKYKFTNKLTQILLFLQLKIMSDRSLSSCAHRLLNGSCKKCGVYEHPHDPAVKTNLYDSFLNCSAGKYLAHMRKRQAKVVDGREILESTYGLLEAICEKFQYGVETLALGIYVYARTCHNKDKDERFWASAALIVASKGIQLDKRVPYLNRYQRYAQKSFSQQEYQLAQRTIFEQLDFDLQYTTFISFLHFYLTSGVLFKSDAINPAILKYIEDDMLARARDFIKTGEFLAYEPEKLALAIVREVRVKFRLDPWKKQLEDLSGFSQGDIGVIEKSTILKPLHNFHAKQNPKLHNISLNPLSLNSLQSSLNLTQQKLKQSKKKLQSTLKFHPNTTLNPSSTAHSTHTTNQNLNSNLNLNSNPYSNSNIKQNSNTKTSSHSQVVPLTSLRNQVISATHKYSNYGAGNGANSQRVITLNSFVTRRF